MAQQIFAISNYYYNPWAIPVFFVPFIFTLMGIYVWRRNKKSPINISYLIVCLSASLWLFATAGMFTSKDVELGLFWNKIIWMGVPFISTSVYSYSVAWLELKRQKRIVMVSYILAFIFVLLAVGSKYFIAGGKKHFWGVYPEYGILSYFFLLFHFSMMIASFSNFIISYGKTSSLLRRKQIRYVFLALIIAYMASVDYLPALKIEVYPFGYIFILLFISIIAFTVIRYRLMDIDTVIHRTVLWILTSCSVLIPIGIFLYFTRSWLATLNWIQLTFVITGLFYVYLFYYRKMQPKIDHLFRRKKYDYYQVLGEIGQKIGSELDINRVISRLFKELKEVLYIRNGLVLVQQPGQLDYTEAGNISYDTIVESRKAERIVLAYQSSFSQWLSSHQKALEREQVEVDPQYESIKQEALSFLNQNSIEVLIPVIMENKVNALVGIGKKENLQAYTIKDIELLENVGRQIGITIDNALHHEDIVEKERLAEELKLGREIQMALLPQETPQIPGLTVLGLMQPAKEIGGDYYDFITLPKKDELAIVIGDVSGKGVAAGLLMAMAKTAIHTLSQEETSPKQILLRTNQILNRHIGGQKFMTLLYLKWQYPNLSLAYSSAGHEYILIYRHQTQTLEAIQSGGFMLGMLSEIETFLEEKQIKLQLHDKILLYTDGVTEAENQISDRFGLERLKEAFKKHSTKPANELMRAIKDEVYTFIGTHPQYDDITLVVMEAT